jgi:ubiquinol-cytochrome c reductase cytochrome b subunit
MTEQGAAMVMIQRENATDAVATGVSGGSAQTRTVTASTQDELEAAIQEVKDEVGTSAPFFRVERSLPFTFTVTRFSQVLTLYYFLYFLVILPLLGLRETPGRVPDTIAKPVTAQGAS